MECNVLNKLGPEYASFVSSFHTHRLTMGSAYVKPSFASFSEMLIHEQQKLLSMGFIKPSKNQALLANQPKGQKDSKQSDKKQKNSKKKPHTDQAQNKSSSKGDSSKKNYTCS